MNIFVSPIFALTFATVFIIISGYCLKCILFYHENREKIEGDNYLSDTNNLGTINIGNNSNFTGSYFSEKRFKNEDGTITSIKYEGGKLVNE